MRVYRKPAILGALLAMLIVIPRSVSAQDQKTKAEIQRVAIKRVLSAERMDRVVVVPTNPLDVQTVAEIAAKLGSGKSSEICNRSRACDWAPEKGYLAVSAEITSFADSTATVEVVAWGKFEKPNKNAGPSTFASGQTLHLRKRLNQWVITGGELYWET
jgi:hypothetical protein